ncbi:MAG: hypothetical protein ACXWOH_11395 [Bdellovibrionota bacterium]
MIPDALLLLKSGGVESKAAFELELSQKSRKILCEKFEAYLVSKEFDFSFFVAKDERLLEVLKRAYDYTVANSLKVKIAKERNGIYFATLGEIRRKGIDAEFVGAHDTLSFAELT